MDVVVKSGSLPGLKCTSSKSEEDTDGICVPLEARKTASISLNLITLLTKMFVLKRNFLASSEQRLVVFEPEFRRTAQVFKKGGLREAWGHFRSCSHLGTAIVFVLFYA